MTKKSTEAKYFGKTQTDFCQISVSNTSAGKCSNPDHLELAPHCAN